MSKINDLIKQLCPDGVEMVKLGDLEDVSCIRLGRGNVISKEDIISTPGDYPVYSSSSKNNGEMGRYGEYMFDDERITWSIDGGGKLFYRNNHKYSVTNVCGYLSVIDSKKISTRFLYYALYQAWTKTVFDYNNKALPSVIRNVYIIPLPPLPIQQELVRILDKFTLLIGKIDEEITLRQKQYEYYCEKLLTFDDGEYEWKQLRQIEKGHCTGCTPKKSYSEFYKGGTIPWLRSQDVKFNEIYSIDSYITEEAVLRTSVKWIPENCVIIAISGATAGRCAINKFKTTTNQHCLNIEIDNSKALYKYVFYCLRNQYRDILSLKQGARGDLNSSRILNFSIPIPPIDRQQEIVTILDKFESIIQKLKEARDLRQKQYEHYREKLLTF